MLLLGSGPAFRRSKLPSDGFLPATVVHCVEAERNDSGLGAAIARLHEDDEYSSAFLSVAILIVRGHTSDHCSLTEDSQHALKKQGCNICYVLSDAYGTLLPEGPYFFHNGSIFQIWRLYEDTRGAFHLPVVAKIGASKENMFESVLRLSRDGHLQIPVPSRLHYRPTPDKPLSGLRFGVKDIFDVGGVPTTGQCRAYGNLYGARNTTAPCIQRLLDLGAVLVGKTKGTQFASGEQPTADWIEFSCPWNPRGDGYLSPRGSSTGTGVAVAAYNWLDFAVGSDTSGSMRSPAAVMGIFGNRPTHDLLGDLEGMIPCARSLDTAGFGTRDVDVFHKVNKAWYTLPEGVHAGFPRPKRLLYPTDYRPYDNPDAQKRMDDFVFKMASFLDVEVQHIDLAAQWDKDDPTGNGIQLKDHVQDIMNPLIWHGYFTGLAQFRRDYEDKFHATPYVDPVIQLAFDLGRKVASDEQRLATATQKKGLYKKWMEDSVLHVLPDKKGHLETIILYPVGDPLPFYRDTYRLNPKQLLEQSGYNWRDKEDHQASIAGLPAITVPIGQSPYQSRISGNTEYMPVCIAIMGAPYTDHALTQLVSDMLGAADLPSIVKAGREAF